MYRVYCLPKIPFRIRRQISTVLNLLVHSRHGTDQGWAVGLVPDQSSAVEGTLDHVQLEQGCLEDARGRYI